LQVSKFAIIIDHSWAAKSAMNKDKQKRPSAALIVVGGFAGTGKTAVSRRLSAELGIPRLGSDTLGRAIKNSVGIKNGEVDAYWRSST